MEAFVNKIAESKFMKWLEKVSMKISASPAFSSISSGMMGTMGLIMVGAVIQVGLAIATLCGLDSTGTVYTTIYTVYEATMGMLGLFTVFNLAYTYAKKLKMAPVNAGFIAMVCFILVCSPLQTVTLEDGSTFRAINVGNLGSMSLFVAIIIGLLSVRISKFATDHNWTIKMPDVVPEGVLNSFNSIIPALINIALWYGISVFLSSISGGALTLSTLIIYILSIPVNALLSPIGIVVCIVLMQLFWFFGIHGASVIYAVMLTPMIAAYATNAELAAQGLPLVFSFIFLMGGNGILGGAGNTLPLVIMGCRSKSKTIKAISKASLPAGIFNINEPVIFGFPIMYNPILLIPFVLAPTVSALLLWAGYSTILAYPQVLIMTTLPVFVGELMGSLSIINPLFTLILLVPVNFLIWYPFFKVYEKKMVAQEAEEEAAAAK